MEKVPDGVLGGYYRGMEKSIRVLGGYCRGIGDGHVGLTWFYEWGWSCLIDLVYEQKGFPLPRDFTKT
jgi:hypothetical protein